MEAIRMFMVICIAYAAAQIIGENGGVLSPNEHHMHLNGCVLPITNELMEFNESRSVFEVCQLITCQEDRKISYKRCENILLPENCTLTDYNFTLPYPHCCATMICNDDTEVNVSTENPVERITTIGSLETHSTTVESTDQINLTKEESAFINSSHLSDGVSLIKIPVRVKENDSKRNSDEIIKHEGNKLIRAEREEKTMEDEASKENNNEDDNYDDVEDDYIIVTKIVSTEDARIATNNKAIVNNDKSEGNISIINKTTNKTAETTLLEPVNHSGVVQKIESKPATAKLVDDTGSYQGCYSREMDVVLPIGVDVEPIDGYNCRRFTCQQNGDTVIATCGVIAVPDTCVSYGNLSRAYPDCCPRVYCPLNYNPISYVINGSDA